MPIYMQYTGIDGDVTTKGFEKWLNIQSCQLACHRNIKPVHGKGESREEGHVQVTEIPVHIEFGPHSQKLWREALTGTGKPVKLVYLQSKEGVGGATLQPYLELTLENTMISNYNMGCAGGEHGGGKPSEGLSLNFTKITYRQIEFGADNKQKSGAGTYFDLMTSECG